MDSKPTYNQLELRVKELEKELRYAERAEEMSGEVENIKRLLNMAPFAVFLIDLSGKIVACNEKGAERLGETSETAVGTFLRDYFPPEVSEIRRLKGMEAIRSGQPITFEDQVGGRQYRNSIFPIFNDKGKPVRLAVYVADVTEYRNALDALEKSKEKYRNILESMDEGYYELDLAGNFTFVNDAMGRIKGHKKDELMHMNIRDYMDPETAKEVHTLYNEVYATGTPIKGCPWKIVRKGGIEGAIEFSASLIKDLQGKALGFWGMVRDVTESRQNQEALKRSQQRLSQIIDFLPDATMVIDLEGEVIAWNRAIEQMTGIRAQDILGKGDYEYAMPFYGERRPVLIDLVGKCDEEVKKTYRYVKKEGESLVSETYDPLVNPGGYLWNKASLLYDLNGNEIGAIESIRDITDMKVAEEALQESEERFRSLSENAPDIIFTLAFDGSFTYVNPAWKAILGHEPEAVLGKYFVEFVVQEEARRYVRIFKDVRDERKTFKYIDVHITHKNGSTRLFSASGAPNINRLGEVTGMVGLFKDITDHRQLENQLRQSQRMEAIGTLSGGIAHDFNNLLMGIQGRTSLMLMNTGGSHPHYEHLKGIEDYVKRAADLTKQLLGFARGGKYEVKPVDINELIQTSSRMFGRTKKEIKIHHKFRLDIWTIEADRGQIEQVLMNLYVNAWQAMPSGGALYLQTENVHLDENHVKPLEIEPGRYVNICVTDTGVGMDEATRQRIFDPFFTTKEMGRGTGLGLASAYGIITNHGGLIHVYSEKGHGTTFNIYLPASEKKIIQEEELSEDLLKGSETILLVDDEDMIIDVAEELLKEMGYHVLTAESGKEAIEIYEQNSDQIDVVVLDMIMPDMSGGDTYDRIKEMDPDVKVLLSSGYSLNGDAAQILDRGCNGFIQKPYAMKQLSQKLRDILDKA